MDNKKPVSLSWDAFQSLGNPDYIPEEPAEKTLDLRRSFEIRVHYEKKGRGGKEACVLRGHEGTEAEMQDLCRLLKTKIGVGGAVKEGEIIIQGNHRDKIMKILEEAGYKKAKKAGG